jgi:mannose-6-phosphate isomerase class I
VCLSKGFELARANTEAERLLAGNRAAAAALGARLLKPRADNLVERPWGGVRLRAFKGLAADASAGTVGESFEIAADDADEEARRYPSVVELVDGSTVSLPALLAAHADTLLGAPFVGRYGARFPLLPKLLDVAELLSVQAHPPGNTEVYVIVAADAGATIRLGFAADIDAARLAERLAAGRRDQQRLLELTAGAVGVEELQAVTKSWLAQRGATAAMLEGALRPKLAATHWPEVAACLTALHRVYWLALDSLNAIPVAPGQVIYNANPPRVIAASGRPASAEVHALGNPEGLGLLALEIRRPGPTYRAWDNVRFPLRSIDIDAALGALNLTQTRATDFVVTPRPVRAGVERSVDCEYFRLEHLRPTAVTAVEVAATAPHSLHALAGAVSAYATDGAVVGRLVRGESALVPVGVGAYRVVADEEPALVVKAELPPYED